MWDQLPVPGPVPVPPNRLPMTFSYRNIGEIVNHGFEIGVNARAANAWTAFANYSWQDRPQIKGIDQERLPNGELRDPINTPPAHRVNFGVADDDLRYFVSTDLSFVDNAFWTDVLDSRYWGPTKSYRQWNAKAGVRLLEDRVVISAIGTNLLDEDIQQHVFGDIIARKFLGEVRLTY